MFPDISILMIHDIVALVTIAEPVHKNLVHHCAFGPVRRLKARNNPEIKTLFRCLYRSPHVITTIHLSCNDFKIICQQFIFQLYLYIIIIKFTVRRIPGLRQHQLLLSLADKIHSVNIIRSAAEPNRDLIIRRRFLRYHIISCRITEKRFFSKYRSHIQYIIMLLLRLQETV